jgi:hypothetical protein
MILFSYFLENFIFTFIIYCLMKTSRYLFFVLTTLLLWSCSEQQSTFKNTVNAVIGDVSYNNKFGAEPTEGTNEDLRIKTHLAYVEKVLRDKDVSNLSGEERRNRQKMLELLHEYRLAGKFPKNHDYPGERIPCFIDKNGNICAVGYLIEQTAGKSVAKAINKKYKYDYVLAMNDATIDQWIASSGLTKEECAMIQPAYGYPEPDPYPVNYGVSREFGIASAITSGLNISLTTINAFQLGNDRGNEVAPIAGLVLGAGQMIYGAYNYPEQELMGMDLTPVVNRSQRNLALMNIGIGTSTLLISAWNLISARYREQQPKKTLSWNVFSYPMGRSSMGVGLSFAKRF